MKPLVLVNDPSRASMYQWLIILTIMPVALLEVVDSTIVNVALPAMMASLGANHSQITWVLTCYVIASAMMLPLTGFLGNRFGYRRLLLTNVSGFMITSLLCGLAHSLTQIVFFRLLQGAFGAALIPISQAILRHTFPPSEQGKAMAIWGLGIMTAPVLGPMLGGYITEYANWRWIFYLNLPVCLLALALISLMIPTEKPKKQYMDLIGVFAMFLGVGCLQLTLDQGNSHNWVQSNFIIITSLISGIALVFFIIRSVLYQPAMINLRLFKDRNFSLCTISFAVFAGCIFGSFTLQPTLLENLFHYNAITAGITMSTAGIASAFAMIIVTPLMNRLNVKIIFVTALLISSYSAFMVSGFTLQASQGDFMLANAVMGFGMGLFMVPLSTYALATLPNADVTEGSGLFSYGRMLGTSMGISLLATLFSREVQINWHQLGGYINQASVGLTRWLQQQHVDLHHVTTTARLAHEVHRHASLLAGIDVYRAVALAMLLLIPCVLLMKPVDLSK